MPSLNLEDESFVEERKAGERIETWWTDQAEKFGWKLAAALVALADALASEIAVTPAPDWTQVDVYRLPEEDALENDIRHITSQVLSLEERRRDLETQRQAAGAWRSLLFEQGKPLEEAVLRALELLGFEAKGLREDGSEFDAVFVSQEGRFIGEVEGKDNRAVNIDKFSQLERNLNEDFAREGVSQFAKGVLFGNAFRLRPLSGRENPFTDKCRTAAARLGVALVNTADLFAPCRYLKGTRDENYARACREAIFRTIGDVAVFPDPPVSKDENVAIQEKGAPA